jgi:hypothetical protein
LSGLYSCLLGGNLAFAQEATTYTYDPLGRLSGSSISGGPNTGVQTATCFDNAGNRSRYQTGSSGLQSCPTPTPSSEPGAPTPSPTPPAAPNVVAYSGTGVCNAAVTFNIVQNDTDPGGFYPITVVSVGDAGSVTASVASSTSITVTGFRAIGTQTIPYVVANSKGATAAGLFTYTTTGTASTCDE